MVTRIAAGNVRIKRAYVQPEPADGTRILVDRLWPRGIAKADAAVDLWMKDIAPSTALRKWFAHDPARWTSFRERYAKEILREPELLRQLRDRARHGRITLVYAARDDVHNDAVVLRDVMLGRRV
jgi:uncharacterized protein YeaO (DUF488 family)